MTLWYPEYMSAKESVDVIRDLRERVASLEKLENRSVEQNEVLVEAYADAARAMLRLEDIGWSQLTGKSLDTRYQLEDLKDISLKMQEWTDTNPLLWRGNEIRCSYLFGLPYEIGTLGADTKISERARADFDNSTNQTAVFSLEALMAAERARYTDGNHFAAFDKSTRTFQVIPFSQITDAFTNPDDPGEVWMYLRTRSAKVYDEQLKQFSTVLRNTWVPVDTWKIPRDIRQWRELAKNPIDWTKVIVDSRVNRPVGETWGMPDAFAAAPWAIAYSAYLRDGTKVLSALAEWAWQMKPKSRKAGENAGATVRNSEGPGKTVITDMEMSALPRANAVDLNTGRPIASQAAAALGVSVVLLLSDPAGGGTANTAATLTDPTIRTMTSRRGLNSQFLTRCLRLLGIKDPDVRWTKMAQDPDHREMITKIGAYQTGLFHEDEARPEIAKLAGFTLLHDAPPEGFMLPANLAAMKQQAEDAADAAPDPAPAAGPMAKASGQGGAKPSSGDNSLRDMDKKD